MSASGDTAHEDAVELVQVESVVKKVPSELTNVRRIVQYARNPEDDGFMHDVIGSIPLEACFLLGFLTLTVIVFIVLLVYYSYPRRGFDDIDMKALAGAAGTTAAELEPLKVDLELGDEAPKVYFMQNIIKSSKNLEA